jgi:HlyD family secretion protein
MTSNYRRWIYRIGVLLLAAGVAALAWRQFKPDDSVRGIASGNGRIEAVEVDIASKIAGRLDQLLVDEGDFVTRGQPLARIDMTALEAQVRQAEAQSQQATSTVATARSQLIQRESEQRAAEAAVQQRVAEFKTVDIQWTRSVALAGKGYLSSQALDDIRARRDSARSAVDAARAQVSAVAAAVISARTQVDAALSAQAAALANIDKLRADASESELKSPIDGRVQYRVAELGEVVAAGGKVLNLIDLSDVHMTFFLPTAQAGKLEMGAEVRIVLDAAPQYVIPARIAFVAAEAQFTPKTVETASEREKLMFRVKAQLPVELLKKHIKRVKSGLPGIAYVRVDATVPWPARLDIKLPQ